MTREDLKEFRYTKQWIEGRIEYIEELKSTVNRLTSVLSDMPKGSKIAMDSEAEKTTELLDCIGDLEYKIKETQRKQMKILEKLDKVAQPYRNILDKCYIQGKTLVTVASEMGYSYERIKHMNGIALNKFDCAGGE
jgi:DNA-directed RNA polymerase sigma subunit (sigma70/sigma32)